MSMPRRLKPMAAKLDALPPDDERWAYEIKWDGIRALAYIQDGRLELTSRTPITITPRYPELADLVTQLEGREAILDGEIVTFTPEGIPSFQLLQPRMNVTDSRRWAVLAREVPVIYEIFDLLWLDGQALTNRPYQERRERLAELELSGPHWATPGHRAGGGADLLAASRRQGLEGVVAKRVTSTYLPGGRPGTWIKVKNTGRQEFVVGGWDSGQGRRSGGLGALLLGYYDPAERDPSGRAVLRYAGKVGTGFADAELRRLQQLLAPLAIEASPFVGPQPEKAARFVAPELVVEVEFTEWTHEGTLRHPSYKGLRSDKAPTDVTREAVQPSSR